MNNYTLPKVLTLICCLLTMQASARISKPEQQNKPLSFIENKGQLMDQYRKPRKDIDYKLSSPGINAFIGDGAIHYQWTKLDNDFKMPEGTAPHEMYDLLKAELTKQGKATIYRMDVTLIGANKNAIAISEDKQVYVENYYLQQTAGNAITASTYNKVTYKNIYPNIDWVLYTNNGQLKYDFVVHPGGNPADIKLKFAGASSLEMKDGALTAITELGSITEQKPYSYNAETKTEVASKFVLNNDVLSFDVAAFDGTLVIDPTINWGTYYGGSNNEWAYGLAADNTGNVFAAGWTNSSNNIATVGAFQTSINSTNMQDAYAVKFNSAGVRQWGTYYGDAGSDWFWAAECDPSGNFYASGYTTSSANLASIGAHQTTMGGSNDALMVKFNTNGLRLWATYYGGSGSEDRGHVTCDPSGNVYLCGETWSTNNIATAGAHQTSLNTSSNVSDAYVVKFTSAGVRLWGTYYGDSGYEENWGSACDPSGNIYVGGWTNSGSGMATPGAHQTTHGGTSTYDGFIAKFNGSGVLQWGTYYGGSNQDWVYDLDCDAFGNLYASGHTYSTNAIATAGAYQTTIGGVYDGFLVKFDAAGVRQWGTYIGGSNQDYAWGLACTPGLYLYVSGATYSTSGIATTGAYQTTFGGGTDAFLIEMNQNTGFPSWGTYYGGSNTEWGYGNCAWSPAGFVYLSGYTLSSNGIATTNAHQTTLGGTYDAFIASFITDTIVYIKQPFYDTVFCPGDTLKVKYGVTYGFQPGNTFSVQLSNAAGVFGVPNVIGTKSSIIDDTIVCVIPKNTPAGNGYRIRIVATNPSRTSFDNGVDIRVKPLPQNLNATSNSPVCVGSTLNLTTTTTSTGTIQYSWTGPNSFTSTLQNPNRINAQTSHAGDYIVTATSDGCVASDTTTVVVNIIPATPTAGSNSPVCPTTTLNLTAASTTPGVTYTWSGPASFSSTQQNPSIPNVSIANAGVYSVTATALGCTSPAGTTNVQVHVTTPTPVAAGNNVLCAGATLNMTASTIPSATYKWTGPNNFNSTQQNPTISPAQVWHSGDYIVRATLNGCVSDPDTLAVQVNIVSTIGGWASPNDTICEGETVTFVAIQTNPGPAPVYQWYKNQVPISGANSLLYTTQSVAHGDTYYCTMHSVGVCTDPITVSTDTIKMAIVNIQVTPSARIISTPAKPIPGQPASFMVSVTNGGYKPTYQWQRNGQNIIGATNANWAASTLHPNDKISCIVTSNDACASPKLANSDTVVVGFPTSINNITDNGAVTLYPNPNNGKFTVSIGAISKSEIVRAEIVNAVGQLVYSNTVLVNQGNIEIAMPEVASGVYLLKLKDGETIANLRFTVTK
ncbi:T9SS type A sorting domain-containing protein [Polluticoccus soli]|uniref:DUF7948 domain-containing protein n=1 Tax=Polluticoccus soli TaxID=3034150 RepID=UPI0023E32012|nr:T9SS type A sorting domain-containing protein [Flavipsychrobacter sp. JY13-12]